jgi:hypothetical protein
VNAPTHAIDFNAVRAALADAIQTATGLVAITDDPTLQGEQRPTLPYFTFMLTTPAAKHGDDTKVTTTTGSGDSQMTTVTSMGIRKMTCSFHCYAQEKEDAWSYMGDWQAALDTWSVQAALRAAGIAVWVIGNVADMSELLNTGYEGRAFMESTFGVTAARTETAGTIDTVEIAGEVTNDQNVVVDVNLTVTDGD